MRRYFLIAAVALALGIVQASFVAALPGPASSLDLPLIMVVALVTGFRFGDAIVAAAVSGLTSDMLSSLPFGVTALIMLALVVITVALFTRVFTHHTWLGTVGINAAVFALSNLAFMTVRAVRATFAGFPPLPPADPAFASKAFAAVAIQLAAVIAAIAMGAVAKRSFSRFFILRR